MAETLSMFGSPTRARTRDPVINSHLLYQLSYRGIEDVMVLIDLLLVNKEQMLNSIFA